MEIKTWPRLPTAIPVAAIADTRLIPTKTARVASLFCLPIDTSEAGTKCSFTSSEVRRVRLGTRIIGWQTPDMLGEMQEYGREEHENSRPLPKVMFLTIVKLLVEEGGH